MRLNPIITKSARERLRPKHLIPWAVVLFTITGFVTANVYLIQTQRADMAPNDAARVTIIPVIVIQAVILMLLGTGAVATGVAQEREDGLLDYQRLTPMRPAAKLIGYLFGLPVREYVIFATTLPFLAFGIIRGGFPLPTTLHFYAIFFVSVLVYHLTGIVAGMLSKRPRQAGFISQGMVLVLYFVLPNLSHLGFTFFEFITIRPALFGLITQEIERAGGDAQMLAATGLTALDSFRDMPFFALTIRPGLYSLMVQSALVATLWTVAHRKFRDDAALPFSKLFSVVFFAACAIFTLGSLWPILTKDAVLLQLARHMQRHDLPLTAAVRTELSSTVAVMLVAVTLATLALTAILAIVCITPSAHRVAAGSRRAAREGARRVPLRADAASGLPATLLFVLLAAAVYTLAARLAIANQRFTIDPPLHLLAAPLLLFAVLLVSTQAALERFGPRAAFLGAFLLWLVPGFTALILGAAFELEVLATYTATPFPPLALFIQSMNLLDAAVPDATVLPNELENHIGALTIIPVVLYAALAIPFALAARRRNRSLMRTAIDEQAA